MATVTTKPAGNKFTANSAISILSAAMEAGVNLPYGCGNGFCGTCKAKLLAGKTSYEDGFVPDPLTEEELADNIILCCKAHAATDVTIEVHEITSATEIKPKEFNVKVASLEQVADDVIIMHLTMSEEEQMQFLAGQYIEFILEDGKRRAFSIANAPKADGNIELHLRHINEGVFTNSLFGNEIRIGDILRVEGPLGTFFLRENTEHDIIMVAGGTGLAPIKGMLQHALDEKIQKQIYLYWGVRDVKDLYQHKILEKIAAEHANVNYIPVLSEKDSKSKWDGRTGYVTDVVAASHPDLAKFEVYMAGPPVMIEAGKKSFAKLGLPEDRMFSDSFEIAGQQENS